MSMLLGRARHAVDAMRRLKVDTSGLALIEFAFTLPIVFAVGGWGTELSFLALTNLRVSQSALNLADNVSRVGGDAGGGVFDLREADVNDVLQGTRIGGKSFNLSGHGRVILSSLENTKQPYDTAYVQRIHWQRCIGLMSGTAYDSHYGTTTTSAGTTNTAADAGTPTIDGMGDAGSKVMAPQDGGVMFVEVNYAYQPLFGSLFVGPRTIHYVASFMVRDNRDYTQIFNPSPAASPSTCDKYAA